MSRLADSLIERGLITSDALKKVADEAARMYVPLHRMLLSTHAVPEDALLGVLSEQYGLPVVNLKDSVDPSATRRVPAKLAAHYQVMPVGFQDNRLTLAVSDPLDFSAVEDIETNLGFQVERVLATSASIEKALRSCYGIGAATVERILTERPERRERMPQDDTEDIERKAEDASVIRLVNQLLQDAIMARATDVHFERHRGGVMVRRRIDGILFDTPVHARLDSLYSALVSRIKLMAGLDIVERRRPQDGRASVRVGTTTYDLRISIVPAMHGEDVVIRILPAAMLFGLDQLGFSTTHVQALEGLIAQPHGILFVTGPTGSGKSTTLYACMSQLNQRERKIITIEDPVEYELPGITQTQIRPSIGLTFSAALRSMLRHDPDIMMVGEVRDRETAETAIQTAMTGHLVLSTLHTNDAAGGAARLIDMGIDPYLITSTVRAFMAQRLVRLVCEECRRVSIEDGRAITRGEGCDACNRSGYRGRIAISEMLPLHDAIAQLILDRASAQAIRKRADELGFETLYADGQRKVDQGLTTPEEVLRVTSL